MVTAFTVVAVVAGTRFGIRMIGVVFTGSLAGTRVAAYVTSAMQPDIARRKMATPRYGWRGRRTGVSAGSSIVGIAGGVQSGRTNHSAVLLASMSSVEGSSMTVLTGEQ